MKVVPYLAVVMSEDNNGCVFVECVSFDVQRAKEKIEQLKKEDPFKFYFYQDSYDNEIDE